MTPELRTALERAAQAETREALWAALEPWAADLGGDRDLATVWAEALRTTPTRLTLLDEAGTILGAWPADPDLVAATADALLRTAERRPLDEPPPEDCPAALAAEALARCLDQLPPEARLDPYLGGRLLAAKGNALGLLGPPRYADAKAALSAALALDPGRGPWHADLGLAAKRGRDFETSFLSLRRAAELLGAKKGVLWNLAIAATAMGDGDAAAESWRALGMPVERPGDGLPVVAGLEPVQVRVPTLGPGHGLLPVLPDAAAGFEAVWVQPLSPCHGVLRSPTFREAKADYGDVVLWDGRPVGVRDIDGRRVPTFPLLGVLSAGDERRFRFLAMEQAEGQVERVGAGLPGGVVLYRHGVRVEMMCPRCASGEWLEAHEHLPAESHRLVFGKLLVPATHDLASVEAALADARRAEPGALLAVPGLYEALGRTKDAGTHHSRWAAIERSGKIPAT